MNGGRRTSRGLSEPGLGLPSGPARSREHGARRLAAAVALLLLAIAAWAVWTTRPAAGVSPGWTALAPPAEVPMRTWHWLVFSAAPRRGLHFAIAPSPSGDPARVEALPAWSLQQSAPGYPADAIVIALAAPASRPEVDSRLVDLTATLVAQIPTLSLLNTGADRLAPPAGLDQQRLRYRVRELLMARGQPAR